ncbi:glycoside hydrolase family 13 protein [Agarivorans sp.]|uniref:glycoside hydrolase family 13 protein n=1 Tax=Agarivorans sp. TaxID=1872412 RepID=UPI003CFF78B0
MQGKTPKVSALWLSLFVSSSLLSGCGSSGSSNPAEETPEVPELTCEAPLVLNEAGDACISEETEQPGENTNARQCVANPFEGTNIYLRGGMNSWAANEDYQFTYMCDRFELVSELSGEMEFKVADENWSTTSNWGGDDTTEFSEDQPLSLVLDGANLSYAFDGTYKLILDATASAEAPSLSLQSCTDAPFAQTLYLRGDMNSWAASSEYAFSYYCDGYYLNVDLADSYGFKVADEGWAETTSFGGDPASEAVLTEQQDYSLLSDSNAAASTENLNYDFDGAYTIKLTFADDGSMPVLNIGPQTWVQTGVLEVTNSIALSAHYDSRQLANKTPFGAVPAGDNVDFSFTADSGIESAELVIESRKLEGNQDILEYTEITRIPMVASEAGEQQRWQASYTFENVQVYGYYFVFHVAGESYVLQNNNLAVYETAERGAGGEATVAYLPEDSKAIRRYRHSSYVPDFTIPDWAKDAVYYYIFPERFRNGDTSNDPTPGVDSYHGDNIEFHSNWIDTPWVPGDGSDEIYSNDFFGGDLAGIIEKLDYIKSLGANTLYINPIFEAPSNHKYDTSDYENIDDNFGSNEDFVRLCAEAEARGIRVILDTSLNHSGDDSVYFDRYGRFDGVGAFENEQVRSDSPFYTWFEFFPEETEIEKQFTGWVGYATLPEIVESEGWKAFAYRNEDSVMNQWLDRGASGWRMDVAPWVTNEFWRDWRTHVKAHDPQALTVAETWFDASKHLLGDMFDSTMNYIFRDAILDYAAGEPANELYHNFELMRENYPPEAFYGLMNLLSTHDASRALYQFGYNSADQDSAVIEQAKQRLKLAVLFQMSFPGAPSIFYGDEVGVTGGEDPYNRAPYPWADQGGNPDDQLLADFKALIALRNNNPILRRGSIDAPVYVDENCIVLLREYNGAYALTAFNNATEAKTLNLSVAQLANSQLQDLINNNSTVTVAEDGSLSLNVPALYGTVMLSQ